jgi:hypothetical protein
LKKLLLAGLAAGMLATAAPMAQANHNGNFTGGCGFDTVNQETATGQSWVGEASVVIVATTPGTPPAPNTPNPTASITNVSCEFFINGVSQGTILTAPNGTGVTANAGRFEFSASETDTTTVCTHATINGTPYTHCADGEVTQIPPQAVIDAINAVFQIIADATAGLDPLLCSVIWLVAPTVNSLEATTGLYIDVQASGDCDIYLGDTPEEDRLIDFFPYNDPETVR